MKKIILLITILFVSVISTACINNLAVQELNNKAQEYLAKGETDKAISRLRSSIDLDTSIFETHYNLGIALIQANDYSEAEMSLKKAIELKPDFADSYYSLAVAYQGMAEKLTEDASKTSVLEDDEVVKENVELSEIDKIKVVEYLNSAISNYNKYLAKKPNTQDKDKVEQQIKEINKEIVKYNSLKNDIETNLNNVSTTSQEEKRD